MIVLVVDDEENICDLVGEVLAEQHQVIKAYNGMAGLELARRHQPDLIIADVMMPYMSGLELLHSLQADPATRGIPVILLSAAYPPQTEIIRKAAAFINKPFEIDELENIVARAAGSSGHPSKGRREDSPVWGSEEGQNNSARHPYQRKKENMTNYRQLDDGGQSSASSY